MKTGVSYMGHHDPAHLETDLREMVSLQLDDVLVAMQENDFVHFTGKVRFAPEIARRHGVRPIAIFWGALNLFGGGRSSQFLLEHPEGFQVARDGTHRPAGCYVNPACVGRIQEMIDLSVQAGFAGYFVDEPTPLGDCFCKSCRRQFQEWYDADLAAATSARQAEFRQRCVVDYVKRIADYCKARHPGIETMTCLMPCDRSMWEAASGIGNLDNLGTDIYWVNEKRDVEEMTPMVRELAALCRRTGKIHHEWLQCWHARRGNESRILEQGRILIREKPDALYVWAWKGQAGTTETCDDPATAWQAACKVLELAKS